MEPDQLDDPVLYRQELIKTHSRRLKALEIKASKYGLECPVSIEVEIVEIKEKIAELGGEIDELAKYRNMIKEMKTERKQDLHYWLLFYQNILDNAKIRIRGEYLNDPLDNIRNKLKNINDELSRIDDDDFDITLL
jgi:hypothetical protein